MLTVLQTWDSFDFFTVSLTVTEVAKEFGVENSEVTWVGLTTTFGGNWAKPGLYG